MLTNYLKEKRVRKGLTQKEVSDALGYTTSQFISNWERGLSAPPLTALNTIVDLYGINPKELVNVLMDDYEKELKSVLVDKKKRRGK